MKTIITIDTGTTNTRVTLWQDDEPIGIAKKSVGVRDTAITGSKTTLKRAIHDAINDVLDSAGISDTQDIVAIASGMITSNLGLAEIPHLTVPVGSTELSRGMKKVMLPDVFDQPIWFIPGVKNNDHDITPATIDNMDVVRGEEVEAVGVVKLLNISGPALLILPGSHTKMIKVDERGKITGSITSMTGELLDLLTKQSILAAALDENFADQIDPQSLVMGAQAASQNGLGRTAFSVRLLDMYTDWDRNQRANYLLGAVLENDLRALKRTDAFEISSTEPIYIVGKAGLREALKTLIQSDSQLSNHVVTDEIRNLAGHGAIQVAETRNLFEMVGGN